MPGAAGRRVVAWRAVLSLVVLLPAGCRPFRKAAEPPAPLRSAAADSLLAADVARGESATREGIASAAAAWFDTSVVYLRAGAPILYGRAAAQTVVRLGMPDSATFRWQPLGGGVSRDGRTG
jgi:hypothetical protein